MVNPIGPLQLFSPVFTRIGEKVWDDRLAPAERCSESLIQSAEWKLQEVKKQGDFVWYASKSVVPLPVSIAEVFAYITDMKNWPEYRPNFIRIENPAAARWSNPGDRATVVIKLLNRERALNMELKEFHKDARVTYVSRQRGLPAVHHERNFEAAPEGCVYRLRVEYEPRPGLPGFFDRLLVRRSVEQAMQRTVKNLDRVFRKRRVADPVVNAVSHRAPAD